MTAWSWTTCEHVSIAKPCSRPVLHHLLGSFEVAHDCRLSHRLDGAVRREILRAGLHLGSEHARRTCACAPTCRRSPSSRPLCGAIRACATTWCPEAAYASSAITYTRRSTTSPASPPSNPSAAFYIFPKIDVKKFNITNDEQFALDLLHEKKILLVPGKGFNWGSPDHFRVVYLPRIEVLSEAMGQLGDFLSHYRQS